MKEVIAKPCGRKGDLILIREKDTGNFYFVDRWAVVQQAPCGNGWKIYDTSHAENVK